ncbi:MAG: hypothetical protein M3Q07_03790, partial [Pseudobdellovibrionaceae bacterium]|nr:hypothetical protein [Pseudobdellovibrionaceae bacterium]
MKPHGSRSLRFPALILRSSALVLLPLIIALAQACGSSHDVSKRSLTHSAKGLKIPEKGQNLIRSGSSGQEFLEPSGSARSSQSGTITISGVANGNGSSARVTADPISGSPLLLSGRLELNLIDKIPGLKDSADLHRLAGTSPESQAALAMQLESVVKDFVKEQAGNFAFQADNLKLNMEQFHIDDDSVLLGFDYHLGGSQLMGGHIGFRFSKGQLVQVLSRTFGISEDQIESAPEVDPATLAQSTAELVLGEGSSIESGSIIKVIYPRVITHGEGQEYEFKSSIAFKASDKDGEPYALVRSLTENEVLEWQNLKFNYEGKVFGQVYQRTPGGPTIEAALPFVSVQTDNASGFADALGQISLTGSQAVALLESGSFRVVNAKGKKAQASGAADLSFNDSNSTLAERNVYYHLQLVQQWAKEVINPKWFTTKVTANVNLSETCNAYWDGRTLNFMSEGSTCRNTGELADVVYHEWGHGLDANIGGITDGAYSEGIGDIIATFITKSPDMAPGFQKTGSSTGAIRFLDANHSYPPKSTEVHTEGLVIGSTWYYLIQNFEKRYATQGRSLAKKLFLKSLYTTNQYEDSYEATLALDADGGDPSEGKNFCLITDAFARHGLARRSSKCNGMEEPSTPPSPTP